MGWVENLRGTVIALDSAPLIYFMEEHPDYLPTVAPFFEALDRGEFVAITSTVTLTEVLVLPLRTGNTELADQYRAILTNATSLTTLAVSPAIAEQAALIRASHRLRTPDAIQLATAKAAGASHVLTNDGALNISGYPQAILVDDLRNVP